MRYSIEPVFPFPVNLPRRQGKLAHELHQQLRAAILDGRLPAHSPLPATRTVAEALGVARNTVVTVYDLLIAEGYLIPRKGAKPQVAEFARRRASKPPRASVGIDESRFAPVWRTPFMAPSPARVLPERNFRLGIPDHRHFPHDVWRRLMAQTLRKSSREQFAYAPSQGIPALREAIAQHVAFARAVACTGDDVIVTSGAQQAFDLIARLLVTPGQTKVAVEEPGYPPVRAAVAPPGAPLVPRPGDDEGQCVEIACVELDRRSGAQEAALARVEEEIIEVEAVGGHGRQASPIGLRLANGLAGAGRPGPPAFRRLNATVPRAPGRAANRV